MSESSGIEILWYRERRDLENMKNGDDSPSTKGRLKLSRRRRTVSPKSTLEESLRLGLVVRFPHEDKDHGR